MSTVNIKSCKSCGKELKLKNLRDIERKKFCSRSCNGYYHSKKRMEDPEFKKKFLELSRTKEANNKKRLSGKNNPLWVERENRNCVYCQASFETRKNSNRKYCSKNCSRKCHCIGIVKFSNKESTNIERIMEGILIELGIQYLKQQNIKNISVADFMMGNILIFVDGDYWHNLPGRRNKDEYQTRVLTNMGFEVIRFDGSLIEKDQQYIKDEIIRKIC